MKIAVLSGKGGAGKTFIAVNLAQISNDALYVDADVEEPNGYLYFQPTIRKQINVSISVPRIDEELCNLCRRCVDFCRFNALAFVQKKIIYISDFCHSCGGCRLVCPQNAIVEKARVIGRIDIGYAGTIDFISGYLNPESISGVPIIQKIISQIPKKKFVILDCAPGSGCTVVETVKAADYCIIVGEESAFGCHDFRIACNLANTMNKPYGAIINKSGKESGPVNAYCNLNKIKILGKIPYNYELGTLLSQGRIAAKEKEEYYKIFTRIYKQLKKDYS
ncbi:MAG: 4Fe-4S binding protein [Bacilli bacterium]|nr:4Fe-4S binding protein [Bacilli bacterium]MDD4388236.1 4Fe-4S binding protein [Bacilli bacterium]